MKLINLDFFNVNHQYSIFKGDIDKSQDKKC